MDPSGKYLRSSAIVVYIDWMYPTANRTSCSIDSRCVTIHLPFATVPLSSFIQTMINTIRDRCGVLFTRNNIVYAQLKLATERRVRPSFLLSLCNVPKQVKMRPCGFHLGVARLSENSFQSEFHTAVHRESTRARTLNETAVSYLLLPRGLSAVAELFTSDTSSGTVERVATFKLLAIHLVTNQSWSLSINSLLPQKLANGFISGNRAPESSHSTKPASPFYTAVIRPVLEYAAPVLHHLTNRTQAQQLESIQKRAIHIIFIARQHTDARYRYSKSDRLSVCLCVRYVPVSDENGLTYRHSCFTVRQPNYSSFTSIKRLHEILTGSPLRGH